MMKRWLFGIVCGGLVCGSAWAGYDEDFSSSFGMGMGSSMANEAGSMGYHWARMPIDVSPDHATQSNVMASLYLIYDQTVSNLQAAGVIPFGIINPRTNVPGQYMTGTQYAYVVSNIVERYDGDGFNDMPGLTYPVRVWELVNEYSSTIPGNPGNNLPRTNFISMVIQGRQAIRAACPEAWFAYDPFDTNDTQALLQQMSYTNIDVISFHTYAPLDKPADPSSPVYITNMVNHLRGTFGMANLPRVWITEYAFYDHTGATPTNMVGTQTDNARWFIQTTAYALGSNLMERFIYTELYPPAENDARLKWMTPFDTNNVRRPLYYAYQKMSALIDRTSVRQSLALGDGVYGYRFTANGTNVVVAWNSDTNSSPRANVLITGLGTNTQGILIDAVPDTNGVFTSTNVAISGGQFTITSLSSNPIYLLVNADTLAAPTNVSASDGTATDRVEVAWAAVNDSTGYQVWRHTTNSSAMATLLGAAAATNYTDTTATTGVTYYYWVKATNATLVSAFSAPDTGWRSAPEGAGPTIKANGLSDSITVSASNTVTITVAFNVGSYPTDVSVDWWVIASQNLSLYWYMNSAFEWTPAAFTGNNYTVFHPVYQGGLLDLSSTEVLPAMILPAGMYYFWFAVDYPADGILNPDGPILYDQVTVTVQ